LLKIPHNEILSILQPIPSPRITFSHVRIYTYTYILVASHVITNISTHEELRAKVKTFID